MTCVNFIYYHLKASSRKQNYTMKLKERKKSFEMNFPHTKNEQINYDFSYCWRLKILKKKNVAGHSKQLVIIIINFIHLI